MGGISLNTFRINIYNQYIYNGIAMHKKEKHELSENESVFFCQRVDAKILPENGAKNM